MPSSAHRVCSVAGRVEPDFLDPSIDNVGVLPGAQVKRFAEATWEQVILRAQTCILDPSGYSLSGGLGDLELNRPRGLLLHHDGPRGDTVAAANIADLQPDEIAGAQLAVDSKVE
jgi:hypothetical protein